MENDFIKIDLHIHTPASSDYNGVKDDAEYLKLLRKAKSRKLRIISFTDHNTIEGYRKLLRIKERLENEKTSLSSITDSEQTKNRLQSIEKDLSLFENILVLPGLEFEVNNGIHLLVIFNDNVSLEQINKFLLDGGYSPDNFGDKETRKLSNWDIFALFEESKKYDCIIIDAHTDSSKGILKTIGPSNTRATCFRSPQLSAVCYKNEEQKEKLRHILQTSIDYSRTVPVSFLKFSDAHDVDDVGSPSTWVKLEKISFESLKKAFTNPSEMVSTEEPSMIKILDELLELPNSFGIPNLSQESQDRLKKHICALSNSDGGYILLGVSPEKTKLGIPVEKEAFEKKNIEQLVDQIATCFVSVEPTPRPSVNIYPLQNNKVIVSLHIPKSATLVNLTDDGLVYSLKNGSVSVLSASDVESLVEAKVVKDIEFKISRRLMSVENDCLLIRSLFSSLPIIRSFDKCSTEVRFQASISNSVNLNPDYIEKLKKIHFNGTSRGNIFFFKESQEPRLPYAYLRYTLPLFTLRNIQSHSALKETIYIVPGGGVYFSNRDYPFFSERYGQIIKLNKSPRNARYGMKFTVSFLKSSFLLWYLINKYDDIDLFNPDIFSNIRFPLLDIERPDTLDILQKIEQNFDRLISLENKFLTEMIKLNMKNYEEMKHFIEEHNSKVDEVAYDIDNLIYVLIGLSDDDIISIEQSLRLNDIYIPNKKATAL